MLGYTTLNSPKVDAFLAQTNKEPEVISLEDFANLAEAAGLGFSTNPKKTCGQLVHWRGEQPDCLLIRVADEAVRIKYESEFEHMQCSRRPRLVSGKQEDLEWEMLKQLDLRPLEPVMLPQLIVVVPGWIWDDPTDIGWDTKFSCTVRCFASEVQAYLDAYPLNRDCSDKELIST